MLLYLIGQRAATSGSLGKTSAIDAMRLGRSQLAAAQEAPCSNPARCMYLAWSKGRDVQSIGTAGAVVARHWGDGMRDGHRLAVRTARDWEFAERKDRTWQEARKSVKLVE